VVSRQQAFLDTIRMAATMFARAQTTGELRADLEPMLCASLLFGAIELGLTAFVSGLMEDRSPEALDRAKLQIAESFLRGVLPGAAAPPEASWKQEKVSSGTRQKVGKRS
jgi:TetR/AcrR family fatty acid metabolism transcriptional regulator